MTQDDTTEVELTSHAFCDLLEVLAETVLREFPERGQRDRFLRALKNGLQHRVESQTKCQQMGVWHLQGPYEYLESQILENS